MKYESNKTPMEILVLVVSFFTVLGALFFLILEIYAVIVGHFFGAPFIPSRKEKIATMLELADIKPNEFVADLGSGNGILVLEAARIGANSIGIEINPFLVRYAKIKARTKGLKKARFVKADIFDYSLRDADIVFLYLWPSTLEKLKSKLLRELKPGSRIVSNAFPFSGWMPIRQKNGVFLYRRGKIEA